MCPPGWYAHFIENPASGCTTVTDAQGTEYLPWEDAPGDTVWRYVVMVYCAPHASPPESCEPGWGEECWERQVLLKCKILWNIPFE